MTALPKAIALATLILCASAGCSRSSTTAPPSIPTPPQFNIQPAPTKASSPATVSLSPELGLASGKSIKAALAEPFDTPYRAMVRAPDFPRPKIIRNCLDYLPVEISVYSAGSALDFQSLRSDGARCDALDLLRTAKPAVSRTFRNFSLEHLSVNDLPPGLALVIADEEQARVDAITKRNGSILDVDKTIRLHPKGADKAQLSTKDWTATLTVYVRADFLGDGKEQLLLRRDAAVIGGTYTSTVVFLLSRSSPTARLNIERQRP